MRPAAGQAQRVLPGEQEQVGRRQAPRLDLVGGQRGPQVEVDRARVDHRRRRQPRHAVRRSGALDPAERDRRRLQRGAGRAATGSRTVCVVRPRPRRTTRPYGSEPPRPCAGTVGRRGVRSARGGTSSRPAAPIRPESAGSVVTASAAGSVTSAADRPNATQHHAWSAPSGPSAASEPSDCDQTSAPSVGSHRSVLSPSTRLRAWSIVPVPHLGRRLGQQQQVLAGPAGLAQQHLQLARPGDDRGAVA